MVSGSGFAHVNYLHFFLTMLSSKADQGLFIAVILMQIAYRLEKRVNQSQSEKQGVGFHKNRELGTEN